MQYLYITTNARTKLTITEYQHITFYKPYKKVKFFYFFLFFGQVGVRKGDWFSRQFFKIFGKSSEKGAKTLLHLLQTPSTDLKGGEYYKNCKMSKTDTKTSYDIELAEKLDDACKKILNTRSF